MESRSPNEQQIQELCARALHRLERFARNRGLSSADVSTTMGLNAGYLSCATDLRLGRSLEALAILGASPRAFFEGAFVERPDPREELALERFHPPRARNTFLLSLDPICEAWASRELCRVTPVASRRPAIAQFEDLRFYRHAEARAGLEDLMRQLIAEAPTTGPLPAAVLAEIAAALTAWAAIQRMRGQPDIGGDALGLAFTLARRSRNPWALGLCYKRGAVLMREYGRPDRGLCWIDHAAAQFLMAGESAEQLRLLADRAIFLVDLGELDEAQATLTSALGLLPSSAFREIASAHRTLAYIARMEGNREGESRHLTDSLACYRQPDQAFGLTLWAKGSVEIESGEIAVGLAKLRQALNLLQAHGSYFDVARLALEIAGFIIASGQSVELRSLAGDLLPWLKGIRRERLLREFFDDLLALIEMGELSKAAVDAFHERLAAAASYARKNPR